MEDPIIITVPYKGEEKNIEVQWQPMGYTHRFKASINEVEVFFEPDEERNYRAVIPPEQAGVAHKIDPALLQAVAMVLHDALA
ncbi:hypothetical protein D3H65_17210 [Paraflavitalea soli]|uniref:Uncharacterized protein n=1 Tax=Paraflavitalea soli TaxID=2315862 RepID=A0A3B7MN94_9BACT|nr:hypothetical protein [Paraflavitalea soli]AXY75608.1 hypothetical protein D3H65_17210 [Paraflavitalea soli]